MTIDLTPYAEAIDSALVEGAFCVVATAGRMASRTSASRGSMQIFDRDHLAYWERTIGHLANLRQAPGVAVLYFNRERGMHLRMYGRAELYENGPVREQIMARTPEPELERDPGRTGIGVLTGSRRSSAASLSSAAPRGEPRRLAQLRRTPFLPARPRHEASRDRLERRLR